MAKVLIIDDDHVLCDLVSRSIIKLGHQSVFALTLKDGMKMALSQNFDVIMLDVKLPDGNGIKQIPEIQKLSSSPDIIIMTGLGDPDGAELSITWGAWDYIEKPASVDAMMLPLIRVLEYRKSKEKATPAILDRIEIIGDSPALKTCLDSVVIAASSDTNVLITGETGTGKELLSRSIHKNSKRADQVFIVVDCSAIPEALVESLLFGHEKGAFTGADTNKSGLVKQADKGTLFLDEVGELPLDIQKKFLRVLQEHQFRPVGSKTEEKSNFRLIAATNKNLHDMVKKGRYREDLLYRLNSFVIHAPPLRDRKEDISNLAMFYVAKLCRESNILTKGFSPDFIEVLNSYNWPGNVREMFNALHSALAASTGENILYSNHLPVHIRAQVARNSVKSEFGANKHKRMHPDINTQPNHHLDRFKLFREKLLEDGEKEYFTDLATLSRGNAKKACELSGLSKSRLYHFFKKYGITLSNYTHS